MRLLKDIRILPGLAEIMLEFINKIIVYQAEKLEGKRKQARNYL